MINAILYLIASIGFFWAQGIVARDKYEWIDYSNILFILGIVFAFAFIIQIV